jgi:LemA protein
MRHEAETLVQVVSARDRGLAAMDGSAPLAQSELSELADAQAEVGQGIRRLLALAESYPELRSADQFLELQAQLEGSENRIHVARMAFNEAVRDYNAALEQLPTRTFAQARGYERRAYFQTDESNRHASSLGFD